MSQQTINVGALPNDKTGDPLRTGGQALNANFNELYGNATSAPLPATSIYSVKAYGAVGDGTTDDTTALQACFTAAAAANGIALLPIGTYKFTAQLTLPSNLTVEGQGPGSILLASWFDGAGGASGGATYLVNSDTTSGNTFITLRNLTLQGQNTSGLPTGTPSNGCAAGVLFRRGSDCQVLNCHFLNIPAISVAHQGIVRFRAIGNTVTGGGHDGITGGPYGANDCTDFVIVGNQIGQIGDDGIAINSSVDTSNPGTNRPIRGVIANNTIWLQTASGIANAAGRGILLIGAEDVAVTGNSIDLTFSNGIHLQADTHGSLYTCRYITITGNVIRRAGRTGDGSQPELGIWILGSTEISVQANLIVGSKQGGLVVSDNAQAAQACSNVRVVGNVISGCGSTDTDFGLSAAAGLASGMVDVSFVGNMVADGAGGGINGQGVDVFQCIYNLCRSNGKTAGSATTDAGIGVSSNGIANLRMIVAHNWCVDTQVSPTQSYGFTVRSNATAIASLALNGNDLAGNKTAALLFSSTPTVVIRHGNRLSTGQTQGQVTLSAANPAATVSTAEVQSTDTGTGGAILLSRVTAGGTLGHLSIGAITGGTSFTIVASGNSETSTVAWSIDH